MTDLELDVADSFGRIFPVPTVIPDWDDVRDRAEARRPDGGSRFPSRRLVAIAALIVPRTSTALTLGSVNVARATNSKRPSRLAARPPPVMVTSTRPRDSGRMTCPSRATESTDRSTGSRSCAKMPENASATASGGVAGNGLAPDGRCVVSFTLGCTAGGFAGAPGCASSSVQFFATSRVMRTSSPSTRGGSPRAEWARLPSAGGDRAATATGRCR